MEDSTNAKTIEYIKDHPYIKQCLRKGLINYSALARLIAEDLKLSKKTTKEAILVSARRFKSVLEKEKFQEKKIRKLLEVSELEIRNRITVFTIEKNMSHARFEGIEKHLNHEGGTYFLLHGSNNYTLITQDKYIGKINEKINEFIIQTRKDLVLLIIKSPKEVETTVGVVSYLTNLFSENGVNIVEFLSCWTDTLFIISQDDLQKAISLLRF